MNYYTVTARAIPAGFDYLIQFSQAHSLRYECPKSYPFQASYLTVLSLCCKTGVYGMLNGSRESRRIYCATCGETSSLPETRIYFDKDYEKRMNAYLELWDYNTLDMVAVIAELARDCHKVFESRQQ